jgi:hypothetical protein
MIARLDGTAALVTGATAPRQVGRAGERGTGFPHLAARLVTDTCGSMTIKITDLGAFAQMVDRRQIAGAACVLHLPDGRSVRPR